MTHANDTNTTSGAREAIIDDQVRQYYEALRTGTPEGRDTAMRILRALAERV